VVYNVSLFKSFRESVVIKFEIRSRSPNSNFERCTLFKIICASINSFDVTLIAFIYGIDPPTVINISSNNTVNESDSVTLACTAGGNPAPNITWTRVSDNSAVSFPLTITGKQDEGGYRCTAENGVGSPDSVVTFVNVQCRSIKIVI